MSQWGAEGAAKKGKTYNQILDFYYPGTKQAKAGGNIRVRINADTTPDVVVQKRSGLVASTTGRKWDLPKLHPQASRFRIKPATGGKSALGYLVNGSWHRMALVTSQLSFYAKGAPIRLYLPHGSAEYRGTLRAVPPTPGKWDRDTINVLSLDNYLRGVVPSEAYPSWAQAALRAQAVAARTYAVHQRNADSHGYYDVVDTTGDQVYRGYDAEVSTTNAAIAATTGLIRTFHGAAAYTQFSSSNGGFALAGGEPYLPSQKDPYDTAASGDPNLTWTKTLTAKQFNARFPSVGGISNVYVLTRVGGTGGRYVDTVRIVGAKGHDDISAATFKSWAGLKSTWFSFKVG